MPKFNNPNMLAGFNVTDSYDERQYKVATVGQVDTQIKKLDAKYTKLLQGDKKDGFKGFANLRGYAYLGVDGKIDPALMPPVATTEVYVIDRMELGAFVGNASVQTTYMLLDYWLKNASTEVYERIHGKKLYAQKGDIIIVSVQENRPLTNDDLIICGTYVVVAVPNVNAEFGDVDSTYQFVKISSISSQDSAFEALIGEINQKDEQISELSAAYLNLTAKFETFLRENGFETPVADVEDPAESQPGEQPDEPQDPE